MTKTTRKAPVKATPANLPVEGAADKLSKTRVVELMTESGLSKKDAAAVFDAVLEVMAGSLRAGKSVELPGLGTLTVKATAARQGVRPGTAEKLQIPAGKKVSYKVALALKKSL